MMTELPIENKKDISDKAGTGFETPTPSAKPIVSEKDKEAYFKSFLADKPYEEEVSLLGDKVKIKFRTFSVEEQSDIVHQIQLDQNANIAENNDAYLTAILAYRLGISLISVNGERFAPELIKSKVPEDKEKAYTYVKARYELFKSWPLFKLSAFVDAYGDFEKKVLDLTRNIGSPDFWKASA